MKKHICINGIDFGNCTNLVENYGDICEICLEIMENELLEKLELAGCFDEGRILQ